MYRFSKSISFITLVLRFTIYYPISTILGIYYPLNVLFLECMIILLSNNYLWYLWRLYGDNKSFLLIDRTHGSLMDILQLNCDKEKQLYSTCLFWISFNENRSCSYAPVSPVASDKLFARRSLSFFFCSRTFLFFLL